MTVKSRYIKPEDFEREPCSCPECQQAGVTTVRQIRSHRTGAWLHGYELKRVTDARDDFWRIVNEKFDRKHA